MGWSPRKASFGEAGDASPQHIFGKDRKDPDITIIPPCSLKCLYGQALESGCAKADYHCFCLRLNPIIRKKEVEACLKQCSMLGDHQYAEKPITTFCEAHAKSVELNFPWYMSHYAPIQNRDVVSSGSVQPAGTTSTSMTTITSTLPWGFAAQTYTEAEGNNGVVTVVFAASDTSISETIFVTSTVPAGQAGYTSTFTDSNSAVVTEVIGIKSGASKSGLSTGAIAGVAIVVFLVFIAFVLVLFWLLRRRKNNRAPEPQPETHDGSFPEPISTVSELKANADYFPSEAFENHRVESGGVPIHEIAASQAGPIGHELGADRPQSRIRSTASPVSPSSPVRKPVPSAEAGLASFPPPWDSSGAAEYEQHLRTGPSPEPEDAELAQLKEEVARVKQKRERLQELQALEAREDELKNRILEREKIASSKH